MNSHKIDGIEESCNSTLSSFGNSVRKKNRHTTHVEKGATIGDPQIERSPDKRDRKRAIKEEVKVQFFVAWQMGHLEARDTPLVLAHNSDGFFL